MPKSASKKAGRDRRQRRLPQLTLARGVNDRTRANRAERCAPRDHSARPLAGRVYPRRLSAFFGALDFSHVSACPFKS